VGAEQKPDPDRDDQHGCRDRRTDDERGAKTAIANREMGSTMNISSANPMLASPVRNGSVGSTHLAPDRPISIPAMI